MERDRPVFVVGCPRSGTTMLQLMLHAHPRIAIPPETRFVLEGHRLRRRFGDLRDPRARERLARWIVTTPATRVHDLGLDPEELIAEIAAGPPTLGSAMGIVFRAYARRFGKPRWGDKRPAYIDNLDVVLRLFPDAQIVNIIRDGRDCVASLKEMPWHRAGVETSMAIWARAVDRAREANTRLGPLHYRELRYESLVSDPEPVLRGLCDFLGEDFHPAMTEPAAMAAVAVPPDKTWHERTRHAVSTDRIGSWRSRLTDREIALCEALLGPRLAECGYPLSGATGGTPPGTTGGTPPGATGGTPPGTTGGTPPGATGGTPPGTTGGTPPGNSFRVVLPRGADPGRAPVPNRLPGTGAEDLVGQLRYALVSGKHRLGRARRAVLRQLERVRRPEPLAAQLSSLEVVSRSPGWGGSDPSSG